MRARPAGASRRKPTRRAIRGAFRASGIITSGRGRRATAVWSGERPTTNCRYWITTKNSPNAAKNCTITVRLPALKLRFRNRRGSSMGWSTRSSQSTNAPSATIPVTRPATVRTSSQPRSGPSMIPKTIPATASSDSRPPTRSSRGGSLSTEPGTTSSVPDQGDAREDHVQAEERAPREELEQDAAPEQTQDRTAAGHAHPDADGPRPVLRGERRGDDRQRGRHDRGGPDAHQGAQHDQLRRVAGEHPEPRGGAEHGEAADEQPATAEAVAERAREQQQAGEHDGVGVDDPGDLRLGGAGLPGQAGQGDVEAADGRHDGHQGERDDGEDGTGAGPGGAGWR